MTEYAEQVERISTNVANAYAAVAQMGGEVSDTSSDHLAEAILTIPTVTTPDSGAELCTVDISDATSGLYPGALLLVGSYAYGAGGYGDTPAGGSDLTLIYAAYVYGDRTITVFAPKAYAAYTNVSRIDKGVFSLTTGEADDVTSLTLIVQ